MTCTPDAVPAAPPAHWLAPPGQVPEEPPRRARRELDTESAHWVERLLAVGGPDRHEAERDLHARLLRISLAEVSKRSASTPVSGPELTDLAHQAADDAMLAILAKLAEFRGDSRFITWAYRFVILEVSSKLGQHYWRNPATFLDAAEWERLPDRLGLDPQRHVEAAGILTEVRRLINTELTPHQRRIFVAITVDGVPLDALAATLDLQRGAIYKVMYDTRRKIHRMLIANGYLDEPGRER